MFENTRACLRLALSVGLCAACVLLSAEASLAALKPKGAAATVQEATNPKPSKDDILLPMPCDATMAFRAVGTQAEGYLWDMETLFGCDNCDRQDRDYYERRYSVALSGPFSARDMPSDWRGKLPKAEVGNYYFYLAGKNEVTNFQWKAGMEKWCPSASSPLSAEDSRPRPFHTSPSPRDP